MRTCNTYSSTNQLKDSDRPLSHVELQRLELEILAKFVIFCDDNNLRYYLAYGTLLGAVRHQGFIPWDDDLDVWMPRPDFERFCELYPRSGEANPFLVAPSDSKSDWLVAKFMDRSTIFVEPGIGEREDYGVFIDIFPLDGVISSSKTQQMRWATWLTHMYAYSHIYMHQADDHSAKELARRLLGVIGKLKSKGWYQKKLREVTIAHSYEESREIVSFASPYPFDREVGPRSDFEGEATLEFCGHCFRVPCNYEAVLERIYGSNWRIPARSKSDGHGKAYWRNRFEGALKNGLDGEFSNNFSYELKD